MTALAVLCILCGALYLEKLAHEWRNTPSVEPVRAGYGNVLLLLCLLLAALGALAVFGGVAR
jgi:hypothetical protein